MLVCPEEVPHPHPPCPRRTRITDQGVNHLKARGSHETITWSIALCQSGPNMSPYVRHRSKGDNGPGSRTRLAAIADRPGKPCPRTELPLARHDLRSAHHHHRVRSQAKANVNCKLHQKHLLLNQPHPHPPLYSHHQETNHFH